MVAERVARLDWARDGRDWPHRDASRFVDAGGLRWHVQSFGPPPGEAPSLLLLHGTGAATHSWRDLGPRLGERFSVVAPDLPGHGFTGMPPSRSMSLPGIAALVGALLAALGAAPALVVGHSAGAAIAARMALDGRASPAGLVALNGAFLPLGGLAGRVFSPAARWLGAVPVAPYLIARLTGSPAMLERLLEGTGSTIDEAGRRAYARLVGDPGHVAGAIAMMAHWDLDALVRDLPRLAVPLQLVVGDRDRTVAPSEAARVRARVPGATLETLRGLGHLAHEERPDRVAALVLAFAARLGIVNLA